MNNTKGNNGGMRAMKKKTHPIGEHLGKATQGYNKKTGETYNSFTGWFEDGNNSYAVTMSEITDSEKATSKDGRPQKWLKVVKFAGKLN